NRCDSQMARGGIHEELAEVDRDGRGDEEKNRRDLGTSGIRAVTATRVKEGQTFHGASGLVRYVNLVKLPHTVFALPFALVGVILASYFAPVTISKVLWVVIAFTSARFAAMGFNRIVDRDVDALNPRTKAREIPSGALSVAAAS